VYTETGKELSLSKSATPATVKQAGQVITYTYVVNNNKNAKVSADLFDMSISLVDSPLDSPVVCPFTMLKDGESMTCSATYTVADKDIANGSITNHATATGIFTSDDCHYATVYDYSCVLTKKQHTAIANASAVVMVGGTSAADTETPTMAPPTATQPPATATATAGLPPILTGEVTYCDTVLHLMNMPFVNGFSPQNFKHVVTMNGLPVSCQVNGSNSKLLTCSYPASLVFPADIQIALSGIVVNQFTFNGASCVAPIPPTKPAPKPAPQPGSTACVLLPGAVCP
jgi:uncharacterized Zn-binding protein involved in type VI secretion